MNRGYNISMSKYRNLGKFPAIRKRTSMYREIKKVKKQVGELVKADEGARVTIGTNNAIPTGYNLPDSTTMPVQFNCTLLGQGDDQGQRQGDTVKVKSIKIKYQIEPNSKQAQLVTFAGGVSANGIINVRVILGRVKANNFYASYSTSQTSPQYGQFLDLVGASVANMTTGHLMSHKNYTESNIVVYYDKIHSVAPLNYATDNGGAVMAQPITYGWHNIDVHCPDVKTSYTGTTSSTTNQSENHYYLWVYSDNSYVGGNDTFPPIISFSSQVIFEQ